MGAWCDCLRLSLSWTTDTLLSLSDWLNVRIIMRRSTRYVSMLSQTIQLLLSDPRNYSWWKSAGIWRWSRRLNAVYFTGYEGDYYVGRIPMISACLWILVSCITNLKSCLLFLPVISSCVFLRCINVMQCNYAFSGCWRRWDLVASLPKADRVR